MSNKELDIISFATKRIMASLVFRPDVFQLGLRLELVNERGFCLECERLHVREGVGGILYVGPLAIKLAYAWNVSDIEMENTDGDKQMGSGPTSAGEGNHPAS